MKLKHGQASNSQQTKCRNVFLSVCVVAKKTVVRPLKSQVCTLFQATLLCSCTGVCVYFILVFTSCLCACVYSMSSIVSRCLLTFYGFLFINWKHDGVLLGPDGWSRRIEKAISFTGITACQAVHTHCCMCLQAKMEQLSLLLGSHGPRAHADTHCTAQARGGRQ